MKKTKKTSRPTKRKSVKKNNAPHIMRYFILIVFCIACVSWLIHSVIFYKKCDFYRNGQCITCDLDQDFPVGYKENCSKCEHKKAQYVEGGLIASWLCISDQHQTDEENLEDIVIEKDTTPCPSSKPLKDIVGNCYACETPDPVRILHVSKTTPCQKTRYLLPDDLALKSLKCPLFQDIHDPEVCFSCHGIWQGDFCTNVGQTTFCQSNEDCPQNQWCFPFRINQQHKGICTKIPETKWICSQTDGYDLKTTQEFCARQNAHIPTLEEIEHVDENLTELCPTLDMWTFFAPDGAVWLESFAQEFLFTREGETEKLGGHHFYALCHKD